MFLQKDSFLSQEQKERIVEAIREAEHLTSGEIRIHLEANCSKKEPLERAVEVFNKQKMYDTKDRNAILIYVAHGDRKFAVYGDKGIHEKVGDDYWNFTRDLLLDNFSKGKFEEGLTVAVKDIGEKLKVHFPYLENDKNELPDEISES